MKNTLFVDSRVPGADERITKLTQLQDNLSTVLTDIDEISKNEELSDAQKTESLKEAEEHKALIIAEKDREKEQLDYLYAELKLVDDLFATGGYVEGMTDEDVRFRSYKTLQDIATTDLLRFLPVVIEKRLYEPIYPQINVLPNLFQPVTITHNVQYEIGGIGAVTVYEGSEQGEPRPSDLAFDTGTAITLSTKKYHAFIRISDEAIEQSNIDIINIWIRAARKAFEQDKELRALQLIDEMGYVYLDNLAATNSPHVGRPTGRDIAGAENGSITYNDLVEVIAHGLVWGFTFDTWCIHPLSYLMFAVDPEMKEIVLENGVSSAPVWQEGQSPEAWGWSHGGQGVQMGRTGNWYGENLTSYGEYGVDPWGTSPLAMGATFLSRPKYGVGVMRTIISPYMPYTPNGYTPTAGEAKDTASVFFADSSSCGLYVRGRDGIRVDTWRDHLHDLENLKLTEYYNFALIHQGKGVGVCQNIVLDRNYVFQNVNQATLSDIDRSVNMSGTFT